MINWKEYESGIYFLYNRLINKGYPNLKIEKDQKIKGKSGLLHEIDVVISFDLLNKKRLMLIECKNFSKRKVEKSDIMILHSKVNDINSSFGIIVTTKGFQTGAKEYADYFGITTLVISELSIIIESSKQTLKVVLPDEYDLPKPFYTIMYIKNGENTGSYKMIKSQEKHAFMLFLSKKEASKCLQKDEKIFPVTLAHLEIICRYSEKFNKGIIVFFGYAEEGISLSSNQLRELYIN
ncbi:restriction endonuclease [Treponema sp. OMZ 799]|uniref:restriction endonuclease n=1 Tax=Treponema sp. OMZ 799 TaxID=2563668 RepID=UPI0020A39A28|nr:restriction endonuclease [Treponema sp. OMZ 799]UTC78191.1 restriction endonuclease [Treponema sp. OMZ 799]